MQVTFSEFPGRHERHFRRKLNNLLFPRPIESYTEEELLEVQRLDHEEIVEFLTELRKKVDQAVSLKATEESDIVLDLKAELEKLYETACRLGDQQANNKAAITDLLTIIMRTIKSHAGDDAKAISELQQEMTAREHHFAMLESSLVADLIDADSLILEDELPAVMLSESDDEIKKALLLLNEEQRFLLAQEARQLVSEKEKMGEINLQDRISLIQMQS